MTVANVSVNKISAIPRQCHPAAITIMVMVGLRSPLGDATWSELVKYITIISVIANGGAHVIIYKALNRL